MWLDSKAVNCPQKWGNFRVVLIVLLVCCLMLPSNWTQNIPERYGKRHAGLEHSWFYPDINTSAAADEP